MKIFVINLCVLLCSFNAYSETLIRQSNLVYEGSFRVPWQLLCGGSDWSIDTVGFGGQAVTFSPGGDAGKGSLYMGTIPSAGRVVEVSIPTPIYKVASAPFSEKTDLNEATVLQCPTDVTEGNIKNILAGGAPFTSGDVYYGGFMVWGQKLIGTVYEYYAGETQILSHFTSGINLSTTGDFGGMYEMSNGFARAISGYMCAIPVAHQAALGGKAISGQGALTTISATSSGPAMFSFDPDALGATSPVPTTTLAYYPLEHPLGIHETAFNVNTNVWNISSTHPGIVFPEGSDTILMLGAQGTGDYCYGTGTSNASLAGTPVGDGSQYCYDPAISAKGGHMYPYESHVWAYSVSELAAVKTGVKQSYEAMPYANWKVEFPFSSGPKKILGAAYDPQTQKIYVTIHDDEGRPIVHVMQLDLAGVPASSSSIVTNSSGHPFSIGGKLIRRAEQ